MSKKVYILICLFVFLLAIGVGFHAQLDAFKNEYIIEDDARMYLFWMNQFLDPELFRNDLLAEYSRFCQPWGLIFSYRVFSIIIMDPLLISKILPIFLLAIFTLYMFRLTLYITDDLFCGILLALIVVLLNYPFKSMVACLARSFAFPLISAFFFYFVKREYWKTAIVMILQCLFYPMMFLISGLTYFFSFLSIRFKKVSLDKSKSKIVFFILAILIGGFLLFSKHVFLKNPSIGKIVSREQMLKDPAFYSGGRSAQLPVWNFWDATQYYLTDNILTEFWNPLKVPKKTWKFIDRKIIFPLIIIWLFIIFFGRSKSSKKGIVYLFLSSLLLYNAAALVMPKLFWPTRYLNYTLPMISLLIIMIAISKIFVFIRTIKLKKIKILFSSGLQIFLIVIVIFVLSVLKTRQTGMDDYSSAKELCSFLSTLPKDVVIGAHPVVADNIPTFAKRSVFIKYELSQPFFDKYWETIKRRTYDFFNAYYGEDPIAIYRFCEENNIDYLVVDKSQFSEYYLNKKKKYFNPFSDYIDEIIKQRSDFALMAVSPEDKLYEGKTLFVIHRDSLKRLPQLREAGYRRIAHFIDEHITEDSGIVFLENGAWKILAGYLSGRAMAKVVDKIDKVIEKAEDITVIGIPPGMMDDVAAVKGFSVVDVLTADGTLIGVAQLKKEYPPEITVAVLEEEYVGGGTVTVNIREKNMNKNFVQLNPLFVVLRDHDGKVVERKLSINDVLPGQSEQVNVSLELLRDPGEYQIEVYRLKEAMCFSPLESDFYSVTGKVVGDRVPFSGLAVETKRGISEPGYMVYGPYIKLEKGEYLLAYYMAIDNCNTGDEVGLIDTAVAGGDRILASKVLRCGSVGDENEYRYYYLRFMLAQPEKMEFRVRYDGKSNIKCGGILIFKNDIDEIIAKGKLLFKKEVIISQ